MSRTAIATIAILMLAAIAAAGFAYYHFRQPAPAPAGQTSEAALLDRLSSQWPQLEQGPLKHNAESGHWFLDAAKVIGTSTVFAYYEDGLNTQYAMLRYGDSGFTVLRTFPDYGTFLASNSSFADPGYAPSTYTYDQNTHTFTRVASYPAFSAGSQSGTATTTVFTALLNPDQTLPNQAKPGDITGCDNVVLEPHAISATTTPLTAALGLLLSDKTRTSPQNASGWLYNYIGKGNLELASVAIASGTAKIYLTGTKPPLGGVCDDPRLLIQVTETARQFPTVQKVELYVNGVRETGSGNEKGV